MTKSMRPQNKLIANATALALMLFAGSVRTEEAGWPAAWLFHVTANAATKAESYDLELEHGGLAQPDARDVRIVGPDSKPVSHLISYADATRLRVIFD